MCLNGACDMQPGWRCAAGGRGARCQAVAMSRCCAQQPTRGQLAPCKGGERYVPAGGKGRTAAEGCLEELVNGPWPALAQQMPHQLPAQPPSWGQWRSDCRCCPLRCVGGRRGGSADQPPRTQAGAVAHLSLCTLCSRSAPVAPASAPRAQHHLSRPAARAPPFNGASSACSAAAAAPCSQKGGRPPTSPTAPPAAARRLPAPP